MNTSYSLYILLLVFLIILSSLFINIDKKIIIESFQMNSFRANWDKINTKRTNQRLRMFETTENIELSDNFKENIIDQVLNGNLFSRRLTNQIIKEQLKIYNTINDIENRNKIGDFNLIDNFTRDMMTPKIFRLFRLANKNI